MAFGQRTKQRLWRSILALGLVLGLGLGGCSLAAAQPPALVSDPEPITTSTLKEVAPPAAIQALAPQFDRYQPQVQILSPLPDAVVKQTTVPVKLQVTDFPQTLATAPLRPHIHLIVDNEPYRAVYDWEQPIVLEDLAPGTHTLRVFPVRPWHESYKNVGAYAQTTFHVLTKTENNAPDPAQPLLTYSRPKGDYGAEPILLDYYLTQAPLHLAAQEDDTLADWRIRVTVNNESFLLDQWQSIYLAGFEPGENWVKLEFIDEAGNLITNGFNNTVRVIKVQPGGQDPLSRLMRGELSTETALGLMGLTEAVPEDPLPPPVEDVTPEPTPEAELPLIPDSAKIPDSPSNDDQIQAEETLTPEILPDTAENTGDNPENAPGTVEDVVTIPAPEQSGKAPEPAPAMEPEVKAINPEIERSLTLWDTGDPDPVVSETSPALTTPPPAVESGLGDG